MKMTPHYLRKIFILALLMLSQNSFAQERVLSAEENAVRYMKAFFSINMEEVLKVTHPDTIAAACDTFLNEVSRAEEQGELSQFLFNYGIDLSSDELRSMEKRNLYSLIVSSNNLRAPEAIRQKMKRTKFQAVNSELVSKKTAVVYLAMGYPSPDQQFGLEMRLHLKSWLVVGNAP